jgi:hypothetical protein
VISEAAQVEKSVVVMVSDDASEICACSRKTCHMFGRILIVCHNLQCDCHIHG